MRPAGISAASAVSASAEMAVMGATMATAA
jgi:hypothetical protein